MAGGIQRSAFAPNKLAIIVSVLINGIRITENGFKGY